MDKPKFKPLVIIQTYQDRELAGLSQRLSERKSLPNVKAGTPKTEEKPVVHRSISASVVPPPPPMPSQNTKTPPKAPSTKPKAPPVPQKSQHPPPCPSPDYDMVSISSKSSTLPRHTKLSNGNYSNVVYTSQNKHNGDAVEMESLESFKLNNPSGPSPKPPNNYFNKPKVSLSPQVSNGSDMSTMKKKQRPVSVTIGEYPSGTQRKQPTKFDFLGQTTEETDSAGGEPITTRLASELAQTLSRSNLKKRNEPVESKTNMTPIKPHTNGTVTISVNKTKPSVTPFYHNKPHRVLTKTQSSLDLSASRKVIENMLLNRVTIKIPDNSGKADSPPPNGILKNGNLPNHKPVIHQKSITFGEIPTVINDRSMHVKT